MRIIKENSFKYGLNNVSVEAKDEATLDALIAKINVLGWKNAWTTCVEDCAYGWSTAYAVDCTLFEDFKQSFSEAKVALKEDKNPVKSSGQQFDPFQVKSTHEHEELKLHRKGNPYMPQIIDKPPGTVTVVINAGAEWRGVKYVEPALFNLSEAYAKHAVETLGIAEYAKMDGDGNILDSVFEPRAANAPLAITTNGFYCGRIVEIVDGAVVQKIGRDPDKVVRHDLLELSASVKVGDLVEIKYKAGVGTVGGPVLNASKERG